MKKKYLNQLSIILVSIFIFTSCISNKSSDETEEIQIAANLPLTGYFATYGVPVREGINLYLKNAQEKLENDNISLVFNFQDNQGSTKNAISILQSQIAKKPDIYISGISQQTIAVAEQVDSKEIPHFAWLFEPFIVSEHKNMYRTWVNFLLEADFYKEFIEIKNPKKVAIINVVTDGTDNQFNDIIIPYLLQKNVEVFHESYNISQMDFKNIASKVKDFSADVIILSGFKGHIIQLVKTFREYKLIENSNTMCALDLLDADQEILKEDLEGLYVTAPFFLSRENSETTKWKKQYKAIYKKEPLYTAAYAYDLGRIIHEATILLAKNANSSMSFMQAIDKVKFNGLTGMIEFKENGELNYTAELCKYVDGQLKPIKE